MATPERDGGIAYMIYRTLGLVLSPLLPLWLRRRAANGKEDRARLHERFGFTEAPRPGGPLVWIHGASVGEVIAALPLVDQILMKKERHVLVTSGTVTSASILAERLPPRATHQYVPLDTPGATKRFLDHWHPDLALFLESELWPNLILTARARRIPLGLVNARFTARAHRGWSRMRGLARRVLSSFDLVLAQDEAVATRLTDLGAPSVSVTGSIKADADALPANGADLATFRDAVMNRPILLAASTHAGEEDLLCDVYETLRADFPNLLLVIAPRHPERGADIAALADRRGLAAARRSAGALPAAATALYIADTLGELGLFYRAAPFAFLGGSLIPHGGQNPLEPAKLGVAVVTGPHTANFATIFEVLLAAQGQGRVTDTESLSAQLRTLLRDTALARQLGLKAQSAAQRMEGALATTVTAAEELLKSREAAYARA